MSAPDIMEPVVVEDNKEETESEVISDVPIDDDDDLPPQINDQHVDVYDDVTTDGGDGGGNGSDLIADLHHSANQPEEQPEQKRTFEVSDPEQRGGMLNKWLCFNVSATPAEENVKSVGRRYKDFVWLRDLLCTHFQGVFIPPLPPKKALARFDDDFIKERRHDLERFLNRLGSMPFVAENEAFKAFITRHEDSFEDSKKKIEENLTLTPVQAAYRLQNLFPNINNYEIGADTDDHILRLKEFLTKSAEQLELLWQAAQQLVEKATAAAQEAKKFSEILTVLDGVEKNYAQKPEPDRVAVMEQFETWADGYKKEASCYGLYLEDQIKYEYQDIQAFLDVVTARDAVVTRAEKATLKAEKWKTEEAGAFLSDKKRLERDEETEQERELLEYLDVVTKLILGHQIQQVWALKVESFRNSIFNFANDQLKNSHQISQVWESMLTAADAGL